MLSVMSRDAGSVKLDEIPLMEPAPVMRTLSSGKGTGVLVPPSEQMRAAQTLETTAAHIDCSFGVPFVLWFGRMERALMARIRPLWSPFLGSCLVREYRIRFGQ